MGVRIRLARMGGKKKPFYRIVVADSECPRDGRFLDKIGYYDPKPDPVLFQLDLQKVEFWINKGAKPTQIVSQLIKKAQSSAVSSPA